MGLLLWGSPRKVLREQGARARFPHQSVLVWHQRSSVPLETCVWGGSEAEVLDSGTQCWLWSCGEVAGKWVARAWGSDMSVGQPGTLHVLHACRLQALVMKRGYISKLLCMSLCTLYFLPASQGSQPPCFEAATFPHLDASAFGVRRLANKERFPPRAATRGGTAESLARPDQNHFSRHQTP